MWRQGKRQRKAVAKAQQKERERFGGKTGYRIEKKDKDLYIE